MGDPQQRSSIKNSHSRAQQPESKEHSRYDGMLLANPRREAVATNGGVTYAYGEAARGSRPQRRVRESMRGKLGHTMTTRRQAV